MGDVTPFETVLKHTDRKDKHVAATGIAAVASTQANPVSILTWNIKDFSRSELRRQQLGLIDPDRLLSQWWPTHRLMINEALESTVGELVSTGCVCERGQKSPAGW